MAGYATDSDPKLCKFICTECFWQVCKKTVVKWAKEYRPYYRTRVLETDAHMAPKCELCLEKEEAKAAQREADEFAKRLVTDLLREDDE